MDARFFAAVFSSFPEAPEITGLRSAVRRRFPGDGYVVLQPTRTQTRMRGFRAAVRTKAAAGPGMIGSDMLSLKAQALLTRAGWRPGRRVDVSGWIRASREAEFAVVPAAVAFMEEFLDLHFRIGINDYDIDVEALRWVLPQHYEPMVGERLSVVGEVFTRHLSLLMGESGRLYAVMDQLVLVLGESGEDAIDGDCRGEPALRLEEWRKLREATRRGPIG